MLVNAIEPFYALLFHFLLHHVMKAKELYVEEIHRMPSISRGISHMSMRALSTAEGNNSSEGHDKSIASLWLQCVKSFSYLAQPYHQVTSGSGGIIPSKDSSKLDEKTCSEFMIKYFGLSHEIFSLPSQKRMLHRGHLFELIQSASSPLALEGEGGERGEMNVCTDEEEVSDGENTKVITKFSNGSIDPTDLAEHLPIQRLMHSLRTSFIQSSRQIAKSLENFHRPMKTESLSPFSNEDSYKSSEVGPSNSSREMKEERAESVNVEILSRSNFEALPLPMKILHWVRLAGTASASSTELHNENYEAISACLLSQQSTCNKVTESLSSSIRFAAISLFDASPSPSLSPSDGGSKTLEATDVFARLVNASIRWLLLHRVKGREKREQEICIHFVKSLLPSLPYIKNNTIEETVLELCHIATSRLLTILYSGTSLLPEINAFTDSDILMSLRCQMYEHVAGEGGRFKRLLTRASFLRTDIVTSFEVMQRIVMDLAHSKVSLVAAPAPAPAPNSSSQEEGTSKNTVTLPLPPPPSIVEAKTNAVEIKLTSCESPRDCCLEVALYVLQEKETCYCEVIYRGTSTHLSHSGLTPQCSYAVKCRYILGTTKSSWSSAAEFRTTAGVGFTFDPLKCGPDITISNSGLSASYSGDDSWSTLLGTASFCSGVARWEIKITRSSTAYIFIGVASSAADLTTFLGGCSHGWGFIGEQALYHGREKTKVYGETFVSGDTVGLVIDQNNGTVSFLKNRRSMGIAFENVYGELFPAVAFYNSGQEVQILPQSIMATSPRESIPVSLAHINFDEVCVLKELLYSITFHTSLSHRVLHSILKSSTAWCSGHQLRRAIASDKNLYFSSKSSLLSSLNIHAGERLRTPYGIASVVGAAYGRVWFEMGHTHRPHDVWFFTHEQIVSGREKGMFVRCTYSKRGGECPVGKEKENKSSINLDMALLQDIFEPYRWSESMDDVLMTFLHQRAESLPDASCWSVSSDDVISDFRQLQQQLSKIVMSNVELSHRWGIAGPKRRAVVARIGLLRSLNHLLQVNLPALLAEEARERNQKPYIHDNFAPVSTSVNWTLEKSGEPNHHDDNDRTTKTLSKPPVHLSWTSCDEVEATLIASEGFIAQLRRRVFMEVKIKHFWEMLACTAARAAKTDDDYDYPEDLPQIKINRLKSFRAREAAEMYGIPGDDLLHASMFCQFWKEIRNHSEEKLRITYTHPMDDGQSRAFKVRFDGEGVDDYGGPYREIFQEICNELQRADPSIKKGGFSNRPSSWDRERNDSSEEMEKSSRPVNCFLPLLHPSANWASTSECKERYKYVFRSQACSDVKFDLYKFLGQIVGIGVRSKITLDLNFPSITWKFVVGERLADTDIASFDVAASDFIQHLGSLHKNLCVQRKERAARESSGGEFSIVGPEWGAEDAAVAENSIDQTIYSLEEEIKSIIQDLVWTATTADGQHVELIPGGSSMMVTMENLSDYLKAYVECRIFEFYPALDAFRQGILSVLPESSLRLFTGEEFENIVCGSRKIDVERLKANTEYDDDVNVTDSHIVAFWEVLHSFSELEKSAFLRFVWARPTLPPAGVEFPQKMKIQSAVGDEANLMQDQYLPKAHTCFFSLNLPNYSSKEILASKLRYAITQCTEMDADFRLTDTEVIGWGSSQQPSQWTSITPNIT